MACGGCQKAAADAVARRRASAAMCCTCKFSDGINPSTCRAGPRPVSVALRVVRGECPRNRFPDERGIIRWCGARWFGVPMPVRLWLGLRHPKHPREDHWPGCGCLVRLKTAWVRLTK